jgi:nucleotide-binding universal stress UspA family protein
MAEIKRMLVPTDFSPTADLATEYAVDMASRYGASVLLLHVVDDPTVTSTYLDEYFADLPALRNDMRHHGMRRLSELAKRYAKAKRRRHGRSSGRQTRAHYRPRSHNA